jgi:hypothetical protein
MFVVEFSLEGNIFALFYGDGTNILFLVDPCQNHISVADW